MYTCIIFTLYDMIYDIHVARLLLLFQCQIFFTFLFQQPCNLVQCTCFLCDMNIYFIQNYFDKHWIHMDHQVPHLIVSYLLFAGFVLTSTKLPFVHLLVRYISFHMFMHFYLSLDSPHLRFHNHRDIF